ncbi:hypothetical protein OGATHE_003812 [Ogataea polymorpha]|uniref:Uncharacterized protein n=1 Tax=Ogataea polymorpha TaxID=460523 RepID=A0A9P8P4D6_9ASCO|nr:hypothetical protein OGATHE_003812 [Ogataea polymorpha]
MISSDTLGEDRRNVDDGEFFAVLGLGFGDRIRVGDDDAVDILALVQSLETVVGKYPVRSHHVALFRTAVHSQVLCSSNERGVLVNHIVDNDGWSVLDVSDQSDQLLAGVELGLVLVVRVVVRNVRGVLNLRLLVRSRGILYHMSFHDSRSLDVGAYYDIFLFHLAVLGGVNLGGRLLASHFFAHEPVSGPPSVGVDHGKVDLELVGQGGHALRSSWVFRHYNSLAVVLDVLADPVRQRGARIQIIHRLGEKALHLGSVQIHRHHVVSTSHNQQIGQHPRRDGPTVFFHLRLLGVRELGNDGSDLCCRTTSARRNQNQQLHDMVIGFWRARLDDVYVLVSHRNAYLHRSLSVGKFLECDWSRVDTQLLAH